MPVHSNALHPDPFRWAYFALERKNAVICSLLSFRRSYKSSRVHSTQPQANQIEVKINLANQQVQLRRTPPLVNICIPLLRTTANAETIVIVVALILTLKSERRVLITSFRESIVQLTGTLVSSSATGSSATVEVLVSVVALDHFEPVLVTAHPARPLAAHVVPPTTNPGQETDDQDGGAVDPDLGVFAGAESWERVREEVAAGSGW
jgi:hypothetical protein